MARPINDLFNELLRKAPRFMADDPIGALLLYAMAHGVRRVDLVLDDLVARLDRTTATGAALDALLERLGLRRRDAWEDDEDVAARAYLSGRGPTPGYLMDEVRASLAGEAIEATYCDPFLLVADVDLYADVAEAIVGALPSEGGALLMAHVVIPPLEALLSAAGEYVDVDAYMDLSFMGHLDADLERDPYQRIAALVGALRPAGVASRLEIVDTLEDAHVPLIWRTTSGFIL